jgi:hypothetical protein
MVSFPQVSPPEPCAHLSPPPYAPHAITSHNLFTVLKLFIFYTECLKIKIPIIAEKIRRDLSY